MNLEHVFVTGGYNSDGYYSTTELLNIKSETWRTRASYPYYSDVRANLPFYYQQSFIVFGGYDNGRRSSIIAQYNPASDSWKKLGDMIVARSHHTGIRSLNSFYIYGGYQKSTVEVCTITGDSVECVEQDPPYR